ncbi:hypothetical protein Glove_139g219 [Diversispora epigaea]|uniref:Uncharacterized protein n=1 Tax=Diversispora epigaea TaxID=1348612 RepID=A0A397IVC7_9GLOM|nr:hypothetical protein Glove_139g219 [Diversispora epigaea]
MLAEHCSSSSEEVLSPTSSTKNDSQFSLYDINNLSNPISRFKCRVNDKHLFWSFAISNCVNENESFIAFSRFDAREFRHCDAKNSFDSGGTDERDLESNSVKYLTQVISTLDGKEIHNSLEGGITRFLDSGDGDQSLIIINASGIIKETIKKEKRIQFELPQQLSNLLSRDLKDSLELLHTSIIKNHFMVHSFENRQQIIEMYSLITGDLEILFKRHESLSLPSLKTKRF